ncbi:MAG TPA: hypothetical protein ENK82_08080 [Campylobacterales bacterium]|nr:hypothetical protein [Campylobacterales bacterium]HHS93291.1 hypothetical protein [Campylobacterales bacterium]
MRNILFLCFLLSSTGSFAQTVSSEKSTWGVEVNPFRLFILTNDWQSFSGTISHFDNENGVEIAMPIFYSEEKNNYYNGSINAYEDTETVLNIDLDYRKYFSGNQTEGAYLGAFGRYTYLDARVWDRPKYATVQKFGVGGEIGVKMKNIFNSPFYWGASLKIGGYIGSDNDVFNSSGFALGLDDNKLIVDAELLKVGYEF